MRRDLAVAAVLRGHLLDRPGTEDVDRRLADLIEAGGAGEDVSPQLAEIFARPELRDWVQAVRGDQFLRPPEVVMSATGDRSVRGGESAGELAGKPGAVGAARFVCPVADDCTWFRQRVGDRVPSCPTHEVQLVRRDLS